MPSTFTQMFMEHWSGRPKEGLHISGVAQVFLPHLVEYCRAFFVGMEVVCVEKPLSLAKAGLGEVGVGGEGGVPPSWAWTRRFGRDLKGSRKESQSVRP